MDGADRWDLQEIQPGRWRYGLALLLFLVGMVLTGAVAWSGLKAFGKNTIRAVVPGKKEIQLAEKGTYTIFYEYRSVVDHKVYATGQALSGLRCALLSREHGKSIALSTPSANASYSFPGYAGVSVLSFQIDQPGSYELAAWYEKKEEGSPIVLSVRKGSLGGVLGTVFGALAIGFVSLATAVAITIITFVKRRNARQGRTVAPAP